MTRSKDEATDRQLHRLVGLVALLAVVVLGDLTRQFVSRDVHPPSPALLAALVLIAVVARLASVRVRLRTTHFSINWSLAACVLALSTTSVPWAVMTATAGILIAYVALRRKPIQILFAASKAVVGTAAGGAVLTAFGMHAPTDPPLDNIGAVIAAYFATEIVDELLGNPVVARANRTPVWQLFVSYWDVRAMSLAARFAMVMLSLAIITFNSALLLSLPPLAFSLHLWNAQRMRARAESETWQRLASATEGINDVDLDRVLRLGVTRAAELFSAEQVDIEIQLRDAARLVRGDGAGIIVDGAALSAADGLPHAIAVALKGNDDTTRLGELRLRFRGEVKLSEREQYTLRTFASALSTALRNAAAYTELERIAAEHAHAAAHDALTGLTNRRALLDQGGTMLARRSEHGVMALLLIDLNHFKEINDTLGHAAGDLVIIAAAHRLLAAAGPDDLVARLGGDEFAVLLTGLPAPAVASHRAEALLAALHHPVDIEGMRVGMEASGGVAVATGTSGMVELLRRADVAMYQAKRAGERVAVYTRRRDSVEVGRRTRDGERVTTTLDRPFAVSFQPIVDLATGEVIAAEALARWRDGARRPDDPQAMLEAVDRGSLLPEMRAAVLDLALLSAANWRDAGFDIPVAVNIAPHSLLDARFPELVLSRIACHELSPDRLILELTEALATTQLEVVGGVLRTLRTAGVRLALDDFGDGAASLSMLSQLPVHQIKIAPEFVHRVSSSDEAKAVVRSSVELGRSLNVAIMAEGIETERQRRDLWELGCAAGQGQLFGRPMPASRLLGALHRGCAGRPGALAEPLHNEGSVVRIPTARRASPRGDRLPH
ncbi:bifunctional diguanylate cyclase/phosphodiesterase [Pilimelia columellifera]|uniref:Diguanylate cyclase/phosphodiesterase n=1 Tax=Pilimelia columellifera subsp. columellifera TaxID=706583 RepID=A0ABP6A7B4_9ACTN